jgi:hypothetical protein
MCLASRSFLSVPCAASILPSGFRLLTTSSHAGRFDSCEQAATKRLSFASSGICPTRSTLAWQKCCYQRLLRFFCANKFDIRTTFGSYLSRYTEQNTTSKHVRNAAWKWRIRCSNRGRSVSKLSSCHVLNTNCRRSCANLVF